MKTITEHLSADHRHCDELFATLEEAAANGHWDAASSAAAEFVTTLERHFTGEEQVLFPAFESATGMTSGPTAVMRIEHKQLLELCTDLLDAIEKRDVSESRGLAETLMIMMQQHNAKEEGILYPAADRVLKSEVDSIVRRLEAE